MTALSTKKSPSSLEWPTFFLIVFCYAMWAIGLLLMARYSLWFAPLAALATALHGSLTHEAIHGHPTRVSWINEILLSPALVLILPYRRFRDLHMQHHATALTDPRADPESFYMSVEQWQRVPWAIQMILRFNNSLVGRLLIGPAVYLVRFLSSELTAIVRGNRTIRAHWLRHLPWLALVVVLVTQVFGLSLVAYFLCVAYPAMSLIALRTFAEHQADMEPGCRTAIIESVPFFGILFLYNNLHVVHHTHPALAWYEIPGRYRAERAVYQAANGGYVMSGYGELLRRYGLRAKEPVVHPSSLET